MKKRPESALYKEYTSRLYSAGDYERCAEICREGLAAGIVSRTLRLRQANALMKVKRYEEAEVLFKGLLEEKDYMKRANVGLAKRARPSVPSVSSNVGVNKSIPLAVPQRIYEFTEVVVPL